MADNNDLVESTNVLKEALDELAKSTTGLSSSTLKKLDDSHKKLGKSTQDSADTIKEEIKEREKLSQAFRSMVKDLGQAAVAVRTNRDDFTSLAPAVDAAGTAAGFAAAALGKLTESIGTAISALPIGGANWLKKALTPAIGGIVGGLGKMLKEHGPEVAALMSTLLKFSLAEVQRVSGAFTSLANVGGLAGTSIQGMFESSQKLGLSMDSYAKLIGRNSQGLAFAAGSVAAGAKAVERITTVGTQFEEQFLKLGFSLEQQSDFSAKFLALNRISSRISLNDTKALSEANRKYLLLIDELARVTGKSRDSIAAKLEQEQRELRYGAALDLMTPENREAARKINDMLASISPELSQMYKSSLGSLGTEMSQNFYLMTQGVSEQVRQQLLGKGQVNVQEIVKSLIAGAKGFGDIIGSTQYEALYGGMGSKLDPILVALRLFKDTTYDLLDNAMKAKKDQDKDRKDESENTKNMVKAQIALRDLAKEIDKIVMEKLFPTMANQVNYVITSMAQVIGLIDKYLGGKGEPKPPPGPGELGYIPKTGNPWLDNPQLKKNMEKGQARAEREWWKSGGKYGRPPSNRGPGDPDWVDAPARRGAPPGRSRGDRRLGGDEPPAAPGAAVGGKTQLARVTSESGVSAMVAAEYQSPFQQLVSYLDDIGYNINAMGGFNKRDKRNQPGVPSIHGLGAALDINPAQNPMGSQLVTDMPEGIGKVARSLGLGWGGDWTTPKDAMHFSAATSEGGNLLRAAQGAIISGPSGGYRTAIETHGNEIIIPLKKDSPQLMVETKGMEDQLNLMNLQLRRLDNIIFLMQNSADIQTKIYQATVG